MAYPQMGQWDPWVQADNPLFGANVAQPAAAAAAHLTEHKPTRRRKKAKRLNMPVTKKKKVTMNSNAAEPDEEHSVEEMVDQAEEEEVEGKQGQKNTKKKKKTAKKTSNVAAAAAAPSPAPSPPPARAPPPAAAPAAAAPPVDMSSYKGAYMRAWYRIQESIRAAVSNTQLRLANTTLTITKVLTSQEQDSTSKTVVMFAEAKSDPMIDNTLHPEDAKNLHKLAIKASFPPPGGYDRHDSERFNNSLTVERQMLEHIFTYLIKKRHCPNVVWCMGIRESNIDKIVDPRTTPADAMRALRARSDNRQRGVFLFMDEVPGVSLYDYMTTTSNQDLNLLELYSILFQVYYTLICFQRMGIAHNDLHLRNVRLRKLKRPEVLTYLIPQRQQQQQQQQGEVGGEADISLNDHVKVRLQVHWIAEIIDFDRGSVFYHGIERNLYLDSTFCLNKGECNNAHPLYDVAGFTLAVIKQVQHWSRLFDTKRMEAGAKLMATLFNNNAQASYLHTLPQLWLGKALQKQDQYAIDSVLPALECCHRILTLLDGRMQGVTSAQQQQCYQKSTVRGTGILGAVAEMNRHENEPLIFSLPPQIHVKVGSPVRTMLPDNCYSAYQNMQISSDSSAPMDAEAVRLSIDSTLRASRLQWNKYYDCWNKDLALEDPGFSWSSMATKLCFAFVHKIRNKNTQRPKPRFIEASRALQMACALLTCPMYYGVNKDFQKRMRKLYKIGLDESEIAESEVAVYEMAIWKIFNDTLTDVQIPLLYSTGL